MVTAIFIKPLREAPKDASDIAVEVQGYIEEAVSEEHLEMFQISEMRLKKANQFKVHPFLKCNWDEVKTCLHPVSSEVLEVKTERVVVASKTLENNSRKMGTLTTGLTYEGQNTVTKTWKSKNFMKLGLNIGYKVLLPTPAHISFQSSSGEDTQQSNAVTFGSNTGVEVELDPGEKVVTCLRVTRNVITVKVSYNVCLKGYVSWQSAGWFKSNSKRCQVDDLIEAGGLPSNVTASEVLKIGFDTDGEVVLSDE